MALRHLSRAALVASLVLAPAAGCADSSPIDEVDESSTTDEAGLEDPGAWLHALYVHLLGRQPDPGGLALWTAALEQGTPPIEVARAFLGSEEWRTLYVTALYGLWLRRAPDPGGLAGHVGSLGSGATLDDVMTTFLASEEYFAAQSGSDRATFVRNLYRDVLGRQAADAEVAGWVGSSLGRAEIARGFVTSDEYRRLIIRLYYGVYLQREPEAGGLEGWLGQVQGGMDWREVAARFVTSDEYIALAGGLDAPAASCPIAPGQPQKRAFFTRGNGGDDLTIENEIRTLLDSAVAGSQVRIAMYTFSRDEVAQSIIDAIDREVDVKLVLDGGGNVSPAVQAIIDRDQTDDTIDGVVTRCVAPSGGSCLANNINHNKFITFSELCDGSTHVTLQSSANWTTTQLHKHNNMVVVRNDPALHDAYRGYWKAMKGQSLDPADPFSPYSHHDGDTGTRAFFFPRNQGAPASAATDTVWEILDNVQCTQGGDDFVYLTASLWNGARSYLIDKLVALRDSGCKIRVVVDDQVEVGQELNQRIPSTELIPEMHNKYIVVRARFNGSADVRKLVFTGSHNLNTTSLRSNDEAMLRIDDQDVFARYRDEFLLLDPSP